MKREKSKLLALLLASLLGLTGAKEFYLGKFAQGWAKLAVFACFYFLCTCFPLASLPQNLNNVPSLLFFGALTMGAWVYLTLCLGDFIRLLKLPQATFDQLYNSQKLPHTHSEIFTLYYLYKEGWISWDEYKTRRKNILHV